MKDRETCGAFLSPSVHAISKDEECFSIRFVGSVCRESHFSLEFFGSPSFSTNEHIRGACAIDALNPGKFEACRSHIAPITLRASSEFMQRESSE